MTDEGDHLSENAVVAFVSGRVSGPEGERIEAHIASCGRCGGLVRALLSDDAAGSASARAAGSRSETAPLSEGGLDAAPLSHGARLGRYEILERVGAGAMGVVYAAFDTALDRKVALKLMRRDRAGGASGTEMASRLVREGKAMARLSHPNVVAVYDVGEVGGRVCVAMELIEGRTLRAWLAEAPRSPGEILGAFVAAGRGLAAAHDAGLVHRDFKPDNVLVRTDGRVCVTDFGLARLPSSDPRDPRDAIAREVDAGAAVTGPALTRSGALLGTPAYMAPEQLAGVVADARSDVFAFCVALYEAFHGERPFQGATLGELRARVIAGEVGPAPRGRKVPPGVRAALLVGLRADPARRYPSMAPLLARLEAAPRAARWRGIGALVGIGATAIVTAVAARSARTAPPSGPAAAAASETCASHHECAERHDGAAYICRASDRTCVPIASPDCAPRFEPGDVAADDTVWLGALFPLKGPAAESIGAISLEGANFARAEIARATSGLEGSAASLHVPRVALVACDDSEDPSRAARHLVDDVGVPAILGFGSGQEVIDLASALLIKRGVVSVASLTPSPLITRIPQSGYAAPMVWRTTFSLDRVADALARLVPEVLEPRAAARPRTRVVLARSVSVSALSFAEALFSQLTFNGVPAVQNGDRYREISFPTGALSEPDVAGVAARIVEAGPSVAVLLGDRSPMAPVVEAVEATWPAATPRPIYVVINASFDSFAGYLGARADRRRRLFGITSDSSATTNARFVVRYNEAHAAPVSLVFNPSSSYDAFYLLAYAAYALGPEPVTGAGLAGAFARLVPPGERIEVGPTHVFDAVELLAHGRGIDLAGAASDLDFDLASGEAPSDFALLCAAVGEGGAASGQDQESGVVYRAGTMRVEGTLRCP